MQILYQGAESKIYLDTFDGQEAIVKERISKGYRIKQLDDELRKSRTRKEVKLLTEVRAVGIPTPKILHVDEKNHKIVMENIKGERLKEHLNSIPPDKVQSICFELGKQIGKLHSHHIVHGDLTTSNMILKDKDVYFIDFGLGFFSEKIEDKAVDVYLLQQVLNSMHYNIFDDFKYVLQVYNADSSFIKKLEEIGSRGRYKKKK